jgi:hypothetical protein
MTEPAPPQISAAPPVGPVYSYAPAQPPVPGRAVGIVGFALAFVFPLNIVGTVLCIVALTMARRAKRRNGLALAGMIIGAVGVLFSAAILALIIPPLVNGAQECARLGEGTHVVGDSTYVCTPTSFRVYTTL